MQTFLPYADFNETASALDYRRLGKQRVETKQILMTLTGESTGWVNHPATKMWRGFEHLLAVYGVAMCDEWKRRGYVDNLRPYFEAVLENSTAEQKTSVEKPWFIGNEQFHISHRSNLLRKAPEFYGEIFSGIPNDLPYIWTTEELMLSA